jgi:leader peptidase (prepilin peptidase)/N-methyltransferase
MHQLIAFTAYCLLGIIISISDIKYRIIPNRNLLALLLLSLIVNFSQIRAETFRSVIYASMACAALHLIFRGKIGAGDIKLFWVISFWTTNFIDWLEGLTMSWILGGLFAITYAAFSRWNGKRIPSIPFAPFIILGFLPLI